MKLMNILLTFDAFGDLKGIGTLIFANIFQKILSEEQKHTEV